MTVAELIEALREMPPDLPVVTNVGPTDNPCEIDGPWLAWTNSDIMIWTKGEKEGDRQVVAL